MYTPLVTVPALPEMEPVIVFENILFPEKVLLSARSVDEAAFAVVGQADLQSPPIHRFVKLAKVEKRLVVVALVPVALMKVKF